MPVSRELSIDIHTLRTALTILGEWNAGSKRRIPLDDPQGHRWLMEALKTAKGLERCAAELRRMAERGCSIPMTAADAAKADAREGVLGEH